MKKLFIIFTSIFIYSNANAMTPYIGIGYQQSNVSYDIPAESITFNGQLITIDRESDLETEFNDFAILGGLELSDKISLELSYFNAKEERKNSFYDILYYNTEIDLQIISFDSIFYHKIEEGINNIKLFTLFGISKINASITENMFKYIEKENGSGFNIGVGIESYLSDSASVRFIGKYIDVHKIKGVKNIVSYNMGVKYLF